MPDTSVTCRGALLVLLVLQLTASAADGEPNEILKPAGDISLDDIEGLIGRMAIDTEEKRLYVLSSQSVTVVDTKHDTEIGSVRGGLFGPRDTVFLPDSGQLIIANDRWVNIYGSDPIHYDTVSARRGTCLAYDPATKLVYAGYSDHGFGLAIIDPNKAKKIGDVPLDNQAQSLQLETTGDRIFVNTPRSAKIVVIDRKRRAIVATWPAGHELGYTRPYPMALDEEHHRLFVGRGYKPGRLIVLDTQTGNTVAAVDCCPTPGGIFYDAKRKRVYVSGDGTASAFDQVDPDTYKSVGDVATGKYAITSLFVPSTRKFYVAVPKYGTRTPPAKLLVFDCGTDAAPTTERAAEAAK